MKILLTNENKMERVLFCLSHIGANGLFDELLDIVFVDEKWHYLVQIVAGHWVTKGEKVPP